MAINTPTFVHLRLHSEYSLVDGLVRIKPLVKKIADLAMPAVALTDFNNFFGAVKFYKAAQAAGVKPILGADLLVLEARMEKVYQRYLTQFAAMDSMLEKMDGTKNYLTGQLESLANMYNSD